MALTPPKVRPSTQGKGVTMIYTDSAALKMIMKAPKMLVFDKNVSEPFTIMPEGILVSFYNDSAKISHTLKANYAIHYKNSNRMEAKYNVEVVNKNGEKLNTEHLVFDERKKGREISSDVFVKITTAKEIIMGKGLESNNDFTKYQIKEVTGTIQLKDGEL